MFMVNKLSLGRRSDDLGAVPGWRSYFYGAAWDQEIPSRDGQWLGLSFAAPPVDWGKYKPTPDVFTPQYLNGRDYLQTSKDGQDV